MRESDQSMHPELFDVRDRLYEKFDVSFEDAELAVRYVCSFLDAKKRGAGELIILPQIADWAWHELILDTSRYRSLCTETLGYLLPHLKESDSAHLRDIFASSMEMFRTNYGLGFGEKPEEWLDAGWDRPRYRLRVPITQTRVSFRSIEHGPAAIPRFYERLAEWLPARLVERFEIAEPEAEQAVRIYSVNFLALAEGAQEAALPPLDILGRIAWEEHILWVERYAADCQLVLGRTLDHQPGQASLIQ